MSTVNYIWFSLLVVFILTGIVGTIGICGTICGINEQKCLRAYLAIAVLSFLLYSFFFSSFGFTLLVSKIETKLTRRFFAQLMDAIYRNRTTLFIATSSVFCGGFTVILLVTFKLGRIHYKIKHSTSETRYCSSDSE